MNGQFEQVDDTKNRDQKRRRFLKPFGVIAIAASLPLVAPAAEAIEIVATKGGNTVVDGGKIVINNIREEIENIFDGENVSI